ncbi:HEXXH motif domain-containing protein [Micromonospora sp. NPDC051196]|uniref:HEXXH motif domain-containing protein n=1 Tax=Micromonospora sp. NPDC051196 TaxID=3155281 RepID=UPI00343DBFD8
MSNDPVPLGPTYLEHAHFNTLAAGAGDEASIAALWRAERSWRLIVLRALLDACATRADVCGPLAPVTDAWHLLVQAHGAAPESTEDVLAQPQVGIWAAHTLRRLGDDIDTAVPLWLDVGYLHALAAASAVRAGLSFELDIPARQGAAVLPTVGSASVPPDVLVVGVRARDGQVGIDTGVRTVRCLSGDPDWHEPIVIEVRAGGVGLRVELLDRDVYRDLRGPSSPKPLPAAEVARWRANLAAAWKLLAGEQPDRATAISGIVRTLAPVPRRERFRPLSASGAEAFGGILLSEPDDAVELAVTLVHESQHHKLGAVSHLLTLCEAADLRYYAPWRDDPRPLPGILQGAYAFAGITQFWGVHRIQAPPGYRAVADFEFALWRRQTLDVLRMIAASGRLTAHGQRFIDTLHTELKTCQDDPVPAAALAAADAAALDHRAMWRGHNIRLDPADRDALAVAWQRRAPATEAVLAVGAAEVLAEPPPGLLDARAVLYRHLLVDSDVFGRVRTAPDEVGNWVEGATAADLALVTGDVAQARAGYLRELRQDPSCVHGWVGLGLTQIDRPTDPATRALLEFPELIQAVVQGLRSRGSASVAPDPLELAGWVGRGFPDRPYDTADPAGWPAA